MSFCVSVFEARCLTWQVRCLTATQAQYRGPVQVWEEIHEGKCGRDAGIILRLRVGDGTYWSSCVGL